MLCTMSRLRLQQRRATPQQMQSRLAGGELPNLDSPGVARLPPAASASKTSESRLEGVSEGRLAASAPLAAGHSGGCC